MYPYERPINIYHGDPCLGKYNLLAKTSYEEKTYYEGGFCEVGLVNVYWWYNTSEKPPLDEILEYIRKGWDKEEAERIVPQMKKIYEEE